VCELPKVISEEKRNDIIFHKKNGKESREIAEFLRVTTRSVDKIWRLYQNSGSVENKVRNCGRKSVVSEEMGAKIIEKITHTDLTLLEIIDEFKLPMSVGGLSKWLKKRGLTYKKRLSAQRGRNSTMSRKSGENG
jgi:transposase